MKFPHNRALHIVGGKNSGKTSVMQFLIRELSMRGFRIGAFKHSSHQHPLDKPGSDSDVMRQAGATPTTFANPLGMAMIFTAMDTPAQEEMIKTAYARCDLVCIESFRQAEGPKILVQRDSPPESIPDHVIALVGPENKSVSIPAFAPDDPALVHFIISHFKMTLRQNEQSGIDPNMSLTS